MSDKVAWYRHPLMVLLVAFVIGGVLGIHLEFEHKLSKSLSIFYGEHYQRENEIQLAGVYHVKARKTITSWSTAYSTLRTDEIERNAITKQLKEANDSYELLDEQNLSFGWRIYISYYYAYSKFICADVNTLELVSDVESKQLEVTQQAKECLSASLVTLAKIEDLYKKNLSDSEERWLARTRMKENIGFLRAFAFALQYEHAGTNDEIAKMDAISALKQAGDLPELINKNAHKVRLLKPVFKLAFPDYKPPEETQSQPPLKLER